MGGSTPSIIPPNLYSFLQFDRSADYRAAINCNGDIRHQRHLANGWQPHAAVFIWLVSCREWHESGETIPPFPAIHLRGFIISFKSFDVARQDLQPTSHGSTSHAPVIASAECLILDQADPL